MKPHRRKLFGFPGSLATITRLGLAAAFLGLMISVATVFFLAENVRREIDALASANSDTTQWSLAQAEVDLLYLQLAAQSATPEDSASLVDLRERFDVFYSRVRTLTDSRQLQALREVPEAASPLNTLDEFLSDYVPAIDGEDSALVAALPAMREDLSRLNQPSREFSLLGVSLFASASDERRENVASLLSRIAYLTLALVASLIIILLVLWTLFRRSLQTEREAADARNRLQEVISTSIDGILAVDHDGRVIDYNGAAERIFGYHRDEAIGQDMGRLIIPDHLRLQHDAGMKRYRETGEHRVVGSGLLRLEAKRKDGTVFPVELSISSVVSEGKEIFVSFLRDISQRVADETELIQARDKALAGEKAKAELLAVMSHEMRTPLNGLIGTMELMQDTPLEKKQKSYLAAMETSANLLLHHVNGVLNISKADSGQLDLKVSAFDPARLLAETVESQRLLIEAHGNSIAMNFTDAPAQVWQDPLRLRQVVLNLVGNANKFTRNGDIIVECDHVGGGTVFEIRVIDTGIGIAESDHERIFEDFRTLDASYGRTTEGTGLGLGIARRLVHAMGGEIGLESEPGEGSLFWVRLPIGEPSSHDITLPTELAQKKHRDVEPLSILLVEDNEINRLVAREMLSKAGHRVDEAHDGLEGVGAANARKYDVILMDISMPHMDGIEATRTIRASGGLNAQTPILALTAHALPEDLDRFTQAGINATLTKPLKKRALADALHSLAGGGTDSTGALTQDLMDILSDLREQLGEEQLKALVKTFLREADETLLEVRDAITDETLQSDTAALVHKLVGSASVFGLTRFAQQLRELETTLRAGDVPVSITTVDDLDDALAEAKAQIQSIISETAE